MRAKQFIIEFSDTPAEISKIMQAKGYDLLGKGVDQTAFLEPGTGQVLKIFGTQRGTGTASFTRDQRMFIFWADYCKQHADNPYLPKFSGWETFDYKGDKYLQIRMERLIKLPRFDAEALENLAADNETYARPGSQSEKRIQGQNRRQREANIGNDSYINWQGKEVTVPTRQAHSELVILLGKQGYNLLLDTLRDLYSISKKQGWGYDLHAGNFMRRDDGDPVIVDPWVVPGFRRW